jgi:tetratricopeptide (TPR) repeat protein
MSLAIVYYDLGDFDEAIDLYNDTIDVDPNYAQAYTGLGLIYYTLEDYEEAIENFDQAIEINPGFSDPYANRALTYAVLGDTDQALEDASMAIDLDPESANFGYVVRGYVNYLLGSERQAIRDFEAYIDFGGTLDSFYEDIYDSIR